MTLIGHLPTEQTIYKLRSETAWQNYTFISEENGKPIDLNRNIWPFRTDLKPRDAVVYFKWRLQNVVNAEGL
jgi:hypothetical protein